MFPAHWPLRNNPSKTCSLSYCTEGHISLQMFQTPPQIHTTHTETEGVQGGLSRLRGTEAAPGFSQIWKDYSLELQGIGDCGHTALTLSCHTNYTRKPHQSPSDETTGNAFHGSSQINS